jgi:uncharacterized membrane protein YdbT with pleckstrin-like domain
VDTEPGEHVIFEGHPSWRSILGFYVKGILLTAAAGAVAALVTSIADDEVKWAVVIAVAAIVFAAVLLVGVIKRIWTTYSITNRRLRIRRGIVSRRVQETRLERVQNVNSSQSVLERLLQVGTVDFDTAGTGDSDFAFAGVSQPEQVMRAVERAQREHAAGRSGLGEQQPPAPEG